MADQKKVNPAGAPFVQVSRRPDLSSLTADELAEPMLSALALELPAEVLADVQARVAELQTRANQLEAMKLGYRGDSLVQALEAAEKERDEWKQVAHQYAEELAEPAGAETVISPPMDGPSSSDALVTPADLLRATENERDEAIKDAEVWASKFWAAEARVAELEELLALACWLADTERDRVEGLRGDALAGEGTLMPSMARSVLAALTTTTTEKP